MPTRKKGNNEGSIYQIKLKTQTKWRAMVTLDGRRLSKYCETKRECQDWLNEIKSKIDSGLTYNGAQVLLSDFMENWLTSIKSGIKPNTWYQYNMTTHNHILPLLGKYLVKDIKPGLIQKLYDAKLKDGTGVRTVQFIHQTLHGALDHAVNLGILTLNPTNGVYKPREEEKEMMVLSENQVNQLLLAVEGTREEALYQLVISTGMRQSEVLGLKWSDLDWVKKTITIRRQLSRPITAINKYPDLGKETKKSKEEKLFSSLKTMSGKRTLNLGDATIQSLRRHMVLQDEERKNPTRKSWTDYDLIFPSITGTPMSQSNLYHRFKDLIKELEFPNIRFHDLRHTAASLMLNHNIPPIVVSKRLGHKNVSITLETYGHLIPEINSNIGQVIDDMITPIKIDFALDHVREEMIEALNDKN